MLALALSLIATAPLAPALASDVPVDARVLEQCRHELPQSPRCTFIVVDADFVGYRALAIRAAAPDPKRTMQVFGDSLRQKIAARDQLALRYHAVVGANPEWSVAAQCRAAETLLEFARAVRAAPDPQPLIGNPEALDLLHTELANLAMGADEQARSELANAVALAEQKHVDTVYSRRCRAQLAQLAP